MRCNWVEEYGLGLMLYTFFVKEVPCHEDTLQLNEFDCLQWNLSTQ